MRFTIRDLLWLMVVVALVIMLWIQPSWLDTERERLLNEHAADSKSLWTKQAELDEKLKAVDSYSRMLRLETDALKRKSEELGVPMPKTPLTLGSTPD